MVRGLQTKTPMAATNQAGALALLGLAKKTMGEDVSHLRLELEQVRSLLNDAIATLQKSFYGLVEKTTAQRKLVESLLTSGGEAGNVSLESLVEEVGVVLRRLTTDLTTGASLGTASAARMDALVKELEGTFSLISKLDGIATQTNILAINAYIEAARSGDRGRAFGVVASEVRALSKISRELNDSMSDHVHSVRAAMVDVSSAVHGMGSKGAAAASDAGSRGTDMIQRLGAFDHRMGEVLASLDRIARDIEDSAGAAIRALQFEDMVRQLLECSHKRILRLESVLESMDAASSGDEGAMDRAFADIGESVTVQLSSAVHQESMQGGTVELF